MILRLRSHRPRPRGSIGHNAGPPSQKDQAGYKMSRCWVTSYMKAEADTVQLEIYTYTGTLLNENIGIGGAYL